jgi:hypothetical protein
MPQQRDKFHPGILRPCAELTPNPRLQPTAFGGAWTATLARIGTLYGRAPGASNGGCRLASENIDDTTYARGMCLRQSPV